MYKIYPNEERNTVTLLLSPTLFFNAKYLYTGYGDKGRYFGNAALDSTVNTELNTIVNEIVTRLNDIAKAQGLRPINRKDIIDIEEGSFATFRPRYDKDGNWDKKSYEIALNAKKPSMFFMAFNSEERVSENDIRDYNFALEVEFSIYSDDYGETKVYSIFHRAVVSGKRGNSYTKATDEAWDGFDFKVDDEEDDDDIPF